MQKLGDYIREVDVRNKDLKVTNLLGLSMSKQFRTSTSNIVGVDLSKYKIVNRNVFAFDTMSVIRVHKVPIAMNDTKLPIIVSPAYITFECIDSNILDPCYLMMWFQRAEFDRYAEDQNLIVTHAFILMEVLVRYLIGQKCVMFYYLFPQLSNKEK